MADDLKERLGALFNAALNSALVDKAPDGPLYHYTDAFGLDGIIRTGCVRATHYRYLNDHTELIEGELLLLDVLKELAAEPGLSDGQKWIRERFVYGYEGARLTQLVKDIFVSSFSEVRDDLGQWRAYGGRGSGYAIGFKFKLWPESEPTPKLPIGMMLFRVMYDRAEARALFKKELTTALAFTEQQAALVAPEKQTEVALTCLGLAAWHAARLALRLKNENFHAEKEWRFVAFLEGDAPPDTVETRPSAAGMIPFVKIPIEPGTTNPPQLEEVIVGPTLDPDRGVRGVQLFLRNVGYPESIAESIVVTSEIPFRG